MEEDGDTIAARRLDSLEKGMSFRTDFATDDDVVANDIVNGWNPAIEQWMLGIENDSANYYCMLLELSRVLVVVKWILFSVWFALTITGITANVVIVALGLTDTMWVKVFTPLVLAFGPILMIVIEVMGFNEWIIDCRDYAGDFNILGLRVQSQKRLSRSLRQPGIRFSNAASLRFEELKKEAPTLPNWIMQKYTMLTTVRPNLAIPSAVVDIQEGDDPLDGEEIPEEILVEWYSTSAIGATDVDTNPPRFSTTPTPSKLKVKSESHSDDTVPVPPVLQHR